MGRKTGHVGLRIGVVVGSLLVGLLAAELFARQVRPHGDLLPDVAAFRGDERLASQYRLDRAGRELSLAGEFDVQVTLNRFGMRDRSHELDKPPGVRRILVLGDSFMEARQVPRERSFPALLESELADQGAEVVNTGRSGFGPALEHLVLRQFGLPYAPDVVVQCFFVNDVQDDRDDEPKLVWDEGVPLRMRGRGFRLRLFDLFERSKTTQARERVFEEGPAGWEKRAPEETLATRFRQSEEDWARSLRCIEATAELARSVGAEYLLVFIPHGLQVDPSLTGETAELWRRESPGLGLLPQERLLQFGQEHGIRVLDLTPHFLEQGGTGLYLRHNGHWTEAGHALAASIVSEALR